MEVVNVTKETFLYRISAQLVGAEKNINRRIRGNIAAKSNVLTADEVKEWATTASRILSKKLDVNGYYLVRHDLFSQNTVAALVASDLTNFIAFDEGKEANWNHHLECAFYWLTGAYYVQSFGNERIKHNAENWKYRDSFKFAYEAILSVTEARIYKEYLGPRPPKTGPLQDTIFTSTEAMKKALTAAAKVGILNIDGEKITWVFIGPKTHAITFFWKAAVRFGLVNSDMPMNKVIPGLKELFNYEFGVNAINQSKEVSEYPKDAQELYKRLCDEMRP